MPSLLDYEHRTFKNCTISFADPFHGEITDFLPSISPLDCPVVLEHSYGKSQCLRGRSFLSASHFPYRLTCWNQVPSIWENCSAPQAGSLTHQYGQRCLTRPGQNMTEWSCQPIWNIYKNMLSIINQNMVGNKWICETTKKSRQSLASNWFFGICLLFSHGAPDPCHKNTHQHISRTRLATTLSLEWDTEWKFQDISGWWFQPL